MPFVGKPKSDHPLNLANTETLTWRRGIRGAFPKPTHTRLLYGKGFGPVAQLVSAADF